MSLINSILNVFVGNKSKKDLKEVESIVGSILSFDNKISSLNHDELRNKTIEFKEGIQSVKESFNQQISLIKEKIDSSSSIDEKDDIDTIKDILEERSSKRCRRSTQQNTS